MGVVRGVGMGLGLVMVSGCASMQAGKGMERMQTQVQLLDDRVTQLERSITRLPSSDVSMAEASFAPTSAESEASLATPAASAASASSSSLIKPATREIQQALKNAGFYQGAIDGKVGPRTKEAVREFQRINGLKVDGVVGKQTWAKLSAYTNLATTSGELSAAENLK